MDDKAGKILEQITVSSLEKCVAKLSRISAGKWTVADVGVSCRTMQEAIRDHASQRGTGAAVYFEVKGEFPFTAMIVFRPGDIETISKGFLGFSFSKMPNTLNQAQELLLSELGNIIVNSLISSLSNALHRAFLPSAPKCVQGETQFLLEALWTAVGSGRHSLVSVTLDLQCDKSVTRSELVALIPEGMEKAILSSAPAQN
jgi:chemotaxis protein CheY-P-specific phosphatase CheC